jgi:hypothetical protein
MRGVLKKGATPQSVVALGADPNINPMADPNIVLEE